MPTQKRAVQQLDVYFVCVKVQPEVQIVCKIVCSPPLLLELGHLAHYGIYLKPQELMNAFLHRRSHASYY